MYTREDEDQARRLWKKRLGLALVPMVYTLIRLVSSALTTR